MTLQCKTMSVITAHCTPHTLHTSTSHTAHLTLRTPHTLHTSTSHTSHSTPHTAHPHTQHLTQHTTHCTPYTLHTSHLTHLTLHTPHTANLAHCTPHTPHTSHTSHLTQHTSHPTPYTPHTDTPSSKMRYYLVLCFPNRLYKQFKKYFHRKLDNFYLISFKVRQIPQMKSNKYLFYIVFNINFSGV